MKGFNFFLAAATAAFVFGCQNPDANNPVAIGDNVPGGTIAKAVTAPNSNLISFDQKITSNSPGPATDVKEATGNVIFHITQVPILPISGDPLFDIEIKVNGDISNLPSGVSALWTFSGSIKDRISIPQGKKVVLVKAFAVQGPSVPTLLNIPFTVSEGSLAVGTMSLINIGKSN